MAKVAAASRCPWLTRSRKEALWFYVFIAPWVVGFLAFLAGPIAASAYLSLTTYDIVQPPSFISLQNYSDLFADDLFWQSLKVTTIYSLFSVPLGIALALGVAVEGQGRHAGPGSEARAPVPPATSLVVRG